MGVENSEVNICFNVNGIGCQLPARVIFLTVSRNLILFSFPIVHLGLGVAMKQRKCAGLYWDWGSMFLII